MPKFTISAKPAKSVPGDLVAIIDIAGDSLFDAAAAEGHPAWADLARRRATDLSSPYLALGAEALLYLPAAAAAHFDDREKIRILAAKAFDVAVERRAPTLTLRLDGPAGAAAAPLAAEGIALRAYRFVSYFKENPVKHEPAVQIIVAADAVKGAKTAVEERTAVAASVNRARDLINEPGSIATPAEIEKRARAVAKAGGLKITVLDEGRLRREGYQGLITVGKGSAVPPRMIVLNYTPVAKPAKGRKSAAAAPAVHLGLLGKGVTFDTGGISIKPSGKMWEMKGDMSGAAAVLYAMEAIAASKPPVPVTAVIVTAHNAVDANSVLPGDVFQARNGKWIHVDNTDAEGRLILTDGLWRMGEEKVTHLVDVATLTGACMRALGHALSGAFSGDQDFLETVLNVSREQGEPCWPLPIVEEYADTLKCDIADINNIGSNPNGGASIAAIFLREFVPPGVKWIHLDIAGTFLAENSYKYYHPGALGIMVRTFHALPGRLAGWAASEE